MDAQDVQNDLTHVLMSREDVQDTITDLARQIDRDYADKDLLIVAVLKGAVMVVADLTRGTGRFNVALGAVTAAQGIGAALSTTLAGLVVTKAGYSAAFLVLGGVAAVGVLLQLGMSETGDRRAATQGTV